MEAKMTYELRLAFFMAKDFAKMQRDDFIRAEHVIYSILTSGNYISESLDNIIDNYDDLVDDIENFLKKTSSKVDYHDNDSIIYFDKNLQEVIQKSVKLINKNESIGVEEFFISFLTIDSTVKKILFDYGVDEELLNDLNNKKLNKISMHFFNDEDDSKESQVPNIRAHRNKGKTPILSTFSRDLTALAAEGKLEAVIGRELEVKRLAQILSRKKKNNPVLVGEAGVGKTAIVEGLAIKIYENDCPRPLMNKKIFSLDLTSLVAGTKYRGQFEERIDGLIKELAKNPDIIIFIDEIHTLVGTGNSSGSLDAANILKPALARGEIKCIGATTHEEFREHIEKDGALERRFQKVTVNPPTAEETKEILFKIKTNYEIFHKVTYSDEAINEIVKLSERYITGKNFPDKAIDVMDEVGSLAQITIKSPSKIKSLEDKIKDIKQQKEDVVKSQDYEKAADLRDLEKTTTSELEKEKKKWEDKLNKERFLITPEMVGEVVSNITGIPVSNINSNEIEKIINLEKELSEIVIGQEEAVKTISSAIKRNKTKIRHKNKPIGSFLFIGKSGVGKTYIAKQISKMFFGSEDSVVRIDMSEYSEKINISRLIGAPPGYVGYNEGGQLTKKIKNNPYSLILFDEIEKAHPDVHNLLLQVLDDGFLTDGNGKKIDFKNTIIVMTSNVGLKESTQFKNEIGYSKNNLNDSYSNLIFEKELKRKFSPEFLNRIDDIVYFNSLSENDILKIVDLQLNELKKSLFESNYILEISDDAKEYIAKNGYDENYGVRNLNRYIQKNIEDKISDKILSFNMKDNLTFYLKLDDKNEIFIDVI